MRRLLASFALVAAVTGVVACGADPKSGTAGNGTTTPITVDATGNPATAPSALGFEAPLVGGGTLDFRTLNESTVALWFWAPT